MTRRAQIDTPVVLIFAVVTGILLLGGGAYFVLKQQSSAQNTQELTSLRDISVAMSGLTDTQSTERNITTIAKPFTFSCAAGVLQIGYKGGNIFPLQQDTVFGAGSIDGGVATLYGAPSGKAYRVATIGLLVPPLAKLHANGVFPALPVPFDGTSTGEITTVTRIGQSGSLTVAAIPGFSGEYGTVTFNEQPAVTRPYFSPAMLAGAAIVDNSGTYTCIAQRYLDRLQVVNRIQLARVSALKANPAQAQCASTLREAPFQIIDQTIGTKKVEELTSNDVKNIALAEQDIMQMNDQLIRGDGCATVS